MIPINKGKFINDEILAPLKTIDDFLSDFLNSIYDCNIRNGYSHSIDRKSVV